MRSLLIFISTFAAILSIKSVVSAQDWGNVTVHFIMKSEALSCIADNLEEYSSLSGDTLYVDPSACPDGISEPVNIALIAQGGGPKLAPDAEGPKAHVLVFFTKDQLACVIEEFRNSDFGADRLIAVYPLDCLLEAVN